MESFVQNCLGACATAFEVKTPSRCGDIKRKWRISEVLDLTSFCVSWIIETIPAAVSVWPTCDFTASSTGAQSSTARSNALMAAPTSIGSPSAVPVPCN